MPQSNFVYLEDCHILRVTDNAVLVKIPDGDDGHVVEWLPKSQMADPDTFDQGDGPVTVGITEWIAKQKNIEV